MPRIPLYLPAMVTVSMDPPDVNLKVTVALFVALVGNVTLLPKGNVLRSALPSVHGSATLDTATVSFAVFEALPLVAFVLSGSKQVPGEIKNP